MSNLYDALLKTKEFKKFKVDELLFVEYKCYEEFKNVALWSHNNYFDFVVNGSIKCKTPGNEYLIKTGEAFFAKKGAYAANVSMDKVYCDIIIFVPDEFIKSVIEKYQIKVSKEKISADTIVPINLDETLKNYYHSLLSYFNQKEPPHESLLKLKFEELIINILTTNNNPAIANYCMDICSGSKVSIKEIMENNFASRLSLDDYARLCARSLSTFKRDFINVYGKTPGKWLTEKRIEYAKYLLETTDKNIDDVVFESGFKNRTHFSRIFKSSFGITPAKYKTLSEKRSV